MITNSNNETFMKSVDVGLPELLLHSSKNISIDEGNRNLMVPCESDFTRLYTLIPGHTMKETSWCEN